MIIYFLIIIISLYIIFQKFYKKSHINNNKINNSKTIWNIPGPKQIPFIGTKWIFLWKYKVSKLHEAFMDMNKRYGEIFLEVTASGFPIVNLCNKDDIEKVVRYPSKYPFRPPTEIVTYYRKTRPDRYSSVGITNEQGVKWYELRSKLTPFITSPRTIKNFIPVLNIVCDDFIKYLKENRNSENKLIYNFIDIANLMGLESICTFILGRRMGFLSDESSQPKHIKQLAIAVKKLFISQRDSYFSIFDLWKYFPSKVYNNFRESEETIYRIISELVDESLEEKNLEIESDHIQNVFMNILHLKDLDVREKKSAIIDFIAAGIETMANTLIFMLYYIVKHKDAVANILKEFPSTTVDSLILEDSINKAVYTKACMKEVYRIQPTAFCLARILEEDSYLSDYYLKAGTMVLCHNMIACRNDDNFKNSKEFLPERWVNENPEPNLNSPIISPFGIGKRTCPGKRFVELQLILIIVKLLTAFEIDFVTELKVDFEFLLAPEPPIILKLNDKIN